MTENRDRIGIISVDGHVAPSRDDIEAAAVDSERVGLQLDDVRV